VEALSSEYNSVPGVNTWEKSFCHHTCTGADVLGHRWVKTGTRNAREFPKFRGNSLISPTSSWTRGLKFVVVDLTPFRTMGFQGEVNQSKTLRTAKVEGLGYTFGQKKVYFFPSAFPGSGSAVVGVCWGHGGQNMG